MTHLQGVVQRPDGSLIRSVVFIPENQDFPRNTEAIKSALLPTCNKAEESIVLKAWLIQTKITSEETVNELNLK